LLQTKKDQVEREAHASAFGQNLLEGRGNLLSYRGVKNAKPTINRLE